MFDRAGILSTLRSGGVLGAGFVALSFFIASAVVFSVGQQSSDAVVRRALQIEVDLADVFSALQDAEIGQRGYLLTGNEAFLAPYRFANDRLVTRLDALSRSVTDIAPLASPLAILKSLTVAKRAELAKTLSLFEAGQRDDALALVRAGSGKRLMDDIRHQIDAIDAREDGIVATRQGTLRRVGILTAICTTVAVVLLGCVALAAMREVRRRAQLARFLPAEIAPRLAEGDRSLRAGREVPAAIVFVDIRGSTALAETLPPAALSTLLSAFRQAVSAAAADTGGLVDKFVGDGALVVFGVVTEDPTACTHALAFARAVVRGTESLSADQTISFGVGIGIHHGHVFCGIVGHDERLEFTVLGDTVNVASRLQALTRTVPCTTLVSATVLRAASELDGNWIKVSDEPLRGRQEPLAIYRERADFAGEPEHATAGS